MKRYLPLPAFARTLVLAALALLPLRAAAQDTLVMNQACYKDTTLIDELISKRDTTYLVRPFVRTGDWTLYFDFALSQKMGEQHFTKYGQRTGVWRVWYASGQLREEYDYGNSKNLNFPIGKTYFASGQLRTNRVQYADSLVDNTYFPSGKLSRRQLYDKDGNCVLMQEWCETGRLLMGYNPTSLQPVPANRIFCNGKPHITGTRYRFGYVGAYTEYYANGKVAVSGNFTELPPGVSVYMPTKTGTWKYYNEAGKLVKEEVYAPGKPVKTTKY